MTLVNAPLETGINPAEGQKVDTQNVWNTAEDLKMLRRICNVSGSGARAEKITVPEAVFSKNGDVSQVVEGIIWNLELPNQTDADYIRLIFESRIERALAAQGVNLDTVTHFRVEKGVLFLTNTQNGVMYDFAQVELFPREYTCNKHVLDKQMAIPNQGAIALNLDGKKPDVLLGSGDASEEGKHSHKEWYEKKTEMAKQMLSLWREGRLLDTARAFARSNKDALEALSQLEAPDPKTIDAQFESKFSHEEIFGPYGVYNILLTFERATKGRSIESPVRVELRVGSKKNSAADRYAEAWTLYDAEPIMPVIRAEKPEVTAVAPKKKSVKTSVKKPEAAVSESPAIEKPRPIEVAKKNPKRMRRPVESIKKALEQNPDYKTFVDNAVARYQLPAHLKEVILTWMQIEAGMNPKSSRQGRLAPKGFAQAIPATQKKYWGVNQSYWEEKRGEKMPYDKKNPEKIFFDPEISVDVIAWYLKTTAKENKVDLTNTSNVKDLYLIYNMGGGGSSDLRKYLKNKTEENFNNMPSFLRKPQKDKEGNEVFNADGSKRLIWEERLATARTAQKLFDALYADLHKDESILTTNAR